MADISIRQLAEKLKVSHTAIRNAIADIKAETEVKIGTPQGQGKATLLSELNRRSSPSGSTRPTTSSLYHQTTQQC